MPTSWISTTSTQLRALALACAWIAAAPAFAQDLSGGLLPGLGQAAPAASAPASTGVGEWQDRLAAAQVEQQRLAAQPEGSAPLLAERQLASARRVDLLAARLAAVRAQAARGGDDARLPPPLPTLEGAPPYGVLDVDNLRDQLDGLTAQQSALALTLKSLDGEFETAVAARDAADAALRRQRERSARGGGDAGRAGELARAQLELATLQAQVAELELVQAEATRQQLRARLASLDEPVARLQAEVDRVRGQQRLDEAGLQRLLQDIASEGRSLAAERVRLADQLARRQAGDTGTDPALTRELEALQQTLAVLRELEAVERDKAVLWRSRQEALAAADDVDRKQAAAAALDRVIARVQARQRSLSEQSAALASELRTQRGLVRLLAADDPERAAQQRVLEALVAQRDMLFRLRDALGRSDVLLARTRSDLGVSDRPDSLGGWAERVRTLAGGWLGQVWNYELFSATEATQVDGRVVTIDYGVTVGKSIGMLVLFGLGYWASGHVSRALVNLMARRLHLAPHLARVMRRWFSSILVLVVLMVVLKMARIPITAFAFLGGALAIGVGFGTQNIIKNIISGIIILFERKIRVGDIVSIGGMSGTVQTVDLRATTVRGFDGIDAIVPNSLLLENQISNWSGGSPDVRRSVVVGVAYGSDLRRAAALVTECAAAHASVLQVPAPEVLFEDFGRDSLTLRLLYWARLGGERGGPTVDSDLRFAISDALQVAGIGIAFPQRDVHLDVPDAIRVELLPSAPPAAAAGAASSAPR